MSDRPSVNVFVLLITLVISGPLYAQPVGATPALKQFPSKIIPAGVYEYDHTIVIPRRRADVRVPPPYDGKQLSYPGGSLRGDDEFSTVFRFAPSVTGQLIKTEFYGEGKVGSSWNDGNTKGDKTLLASLCASASDFTVDGRAEIRAYPWGYTAWSKKPDPHGPDHPYRADGLSAEGNGFTARRLRFFQIPGTALVVKGGRGGQAGPYGIYDVSLTEISDIFVASAINGVDVRINDAKLSHIYVTGIVKDGLIISGPGTVVEGDHIWGADRAAVFRTQASARDCYHEAARIGTHVMPGADGTQIDGLNIGPATCWERGVKIEAHGCTIAGLHGMVRIETPDHPDIAGVEIGGGMVNAVVSGALVVASDRSNPAAKADALILRGHRNKVDLKGGWNAPTQATFIRVAEAVTGSTVEIRGAGDGGTVLDLSESKLDRVNGAGNEFKVKWSGNATRVIYPGGGKTYNLAPATQLWIDGELQAAAASTPKTAQP